MQYVVFHEEECGGIIYPFYQCGTLGAGVSQMAEPGKRRDRFGGNSGTVT